MFPFFYQAPGNDVLITLPLNISSPTHPQPQFMAFVKIHGYLFFSVADFTSPNWTHSEKEVCTAALGELGEPASGTCASHCFHPEFPAKNWKVRNNFYMSVQIHVYCNKCLRKYQLCLLRGKSRLSMLIYISGPFLFPIPLHKACHLHFTCQYISYSLKSDLPFCEPAFEFFSILQHKRL